MLERLILGLTILASASLVLARCTSFLGVLELVRLLGNIGGFGGDVRLDGSGSNGRLAGLGGSRVGSDETGSLCVLFLIVGWRGTIVLRCSFVGGRRLRLGNSG